jgi:hypothetical protein
MLNGPSSQGAKAAGAGPAAEKEERVMSQSLSAVASRPVRKSVALAIALGLLLADLAVIAGKAAFYAHDQADRATVTAAGRESAVRRAGDYVECHEISVKLDEGYGLRGQKSRIVCTQAL